MDEDRIQERVRAAVIDVLLPRVGNDIWRGLLDSNAARDHRWNVGLDLLSTLLRRVSSIDRPQDDRPQDEGTRRPQKTIDVGPLAALVPDIESIRARLDIDWAKAARSLTVIDSTTVPLEKVEAVAEAVGMITNARPVMESSVRSINSSCLYLDLAYLLLAAWAEAGNGGSR